jgi:SAM-dependent methyltransferase
VSGRAGGATFIAGSAHDMPFPDQSIDVVFGIAILHHLDLDLVSREVRRVLKPGGRAIFQEPVRNSAVIRFLRSLIPYRAPDISPYERPLTDAELQRFATGFSSASVRAFGLPHVQIGPLLPIVRQYWRTLYAWDRRLLDWMPALERYASIRVISLTK